MPGFHTTDECHTAEMMEAQEEAICEEERAAPAPPRPAGTCPVCGEAANYNGSIWCTQEVDDYAEAWAIQYACSSGHIWESQYRHDPDAVRVVEGGTEA